MANKREENTISKSCDSEIRNKRIESIDHLTSAINLIFFQNLFEEKEDLNLLSSLYQAKIKVLENKKECILNGKAQFIISRILTCVDEIDTTKEWDHEHNKFWFLEMRQAMNVLRQYYLTWTLNKYDIERYSTCLCCNCNSTQIKGDILKKLGNLKLGDE
jgi:hypothetical protein